MNLPSIPQTPLECHHQLISSQQEPHMQVQESDILTWTICISRACIRRPLLLYSIFRAEKGSSIHFDWINIQFYNNFCGVVNFCQPDAWNFEVWDDQST
ncbi:hypothetical protein F5Y17DRAFT_453404 [Xylariaceae sp. FL0594]|nr:hypothetical protein F5Y17DRAFT_453404 [Xylariaceae sp. FL0594]